MAFESLGDPLISSNRLVVRHSSKTSATRSLLSAYTQDGHLTNLKCGAHEFIAFKSSKLKILFGTPEIGPSLNYIPYRRPGILCLDTESNTYVKVKIVRIVAQE